MAKSSSSIGEPSQHKPHLIRISTQNESCLVKNDLNKASGKFEVTREKSSSDRLQGRETNVRPCLTYQQNISHVLFFSSSIEDDIEPSMVFVLHYISISSACSSRVFRNHLTLFLAGIRNAPIIDSIVREYNIFKSYCFFYAK